jgi:endonuclease V-like protein UPF0215 family
MHGSREEVKFRRIKQELRIVGVDDCPFVPRKPGRVDIFGIVFRGGYWVDGAMRTSVEVDGFDATGKIADMVCSSPHYMQLRVIMLDGITFGGFNIVDVHGLFELTGLPVIAVTREKVNLDDVRRALMNLNRWEERLALIESAGEPLVLEVKGSDLRMQMAGVSMGDAEEIVRLSCTRANIPEPLRVAHIIASAMNLNANQ